MTRVIPEVCGFRCYPLTLAANSTKATRRYFSLLLPPLTPLTPLPVLLILALLLLLALFFEEDSWPHWQLIETLIHQKLGRNSTICTFSYKLRILAPLLPTRLPLSSMLYPGPDTELAVPGGLPVPGT